MQSNIVLKTYKRLIGCYMRLNHQVMAPIKFHNAGVTNLLDAGDRFQLTGEVIEYHPVFSEIYNRHGGAKFARLCFEVVPILGGEEHWVSTKITFKGPEHTFHNSMGEILTPDYFVGK